MSKLITTITVGAVSALMAVAATGAAFTGQQGNMDESQWIQQRADREFAIAAQECATLKSSSPTQFDPCMQQAEAARQNTNDSAGGQVAANQGGQGAGQDKGTGIIDKVTDKVAEATKAVKETLGFGSAEKTGQYGVSGQSSQGAFPQQGQMQGQGGQPQQGGYQQGGQMQGQGGQPQQWGYNPGQGGQPQQGGQMQGQGGQPQQGGYQQGEQMQGQGGQSAQHAYTPGHGVYVPGHGVLDPNAYAFTMANREHSIRHQECETIKRSDPQGYERCLEQANAAWESMLRSGHGS